MVNTLIYAKKVGLLCDNCFLPASQFTATSNTIQYRLLNPVIISQLESSHIVTIIEWCRVLAGFPTTLLQHYEHIAMQMKATLQPQLITVSSFLELLHGRLQWATQAISEVHSIDTPAFIKLHIGLSWNIFCEITSGPPQHCQDHCSVDRTDCKNCSLNTILSRWYPEEVYTKKSQ